MHPKQQINRRALNAGFHAIEDQERSDRLILRGTPIVYDTPTLLYEWDGVKYYEIIARGALVGADLSDFVFYFEHQGRVYARTRNGSLKLVDSEQNASVEVELDPNDQGHRELYNDVKEGRLDRMSFAFIPREESFDSTTNTATVRQIKKLYDVSAVAFAAYDQTDIQARCARWKEEKQGQENELTARALERKRQEAIAYSYTF